RRPAERVGEAGADAVLEGRQLPPCLGDGDAVSKPGDGTDRVEVPAGGGVALGLPRHPQPRIAAGSEGEPRWKHAHDGGGLTPEAQRRPEDSGVGPEAGPPEGIGEHDRARAAGLVLTWEEAAPERRTDAEDVEEARRDGDGAGRLRRGAAGARRPRGGVGGGGG